MAIRGIAERQHGVVGHRQLTELGLSDGLIQGRLESGQLIPVHHGVFALGHLVLGKNGERMAAVIACGPGAVLSHESAGELWGFDISYGPPEVTRRSGGSPRDGIRVHQTRILEDSEVTTQVEIPVTSVERTLLDLAERRDARRLERTLVAADRAGLIVWSELWRLLERTPRRPGAGRLRRVALEVDPQAVNAASALEVDFLAICRQAGIPRPRTNVLVEGLRVDFFWPSQKVVVETDGYAYHRDRPAFERDHERDLRLEATGFRVHRATYRMLATDPDPFLCLLRRSLDC